MQHMWTSGPSQILLPREPGCRLEEEGTSAQRRRLRRSHSSSRNPQLRRRPRSRCRQLPLRLINQASLAVQRAFADGVRLQTVEILLRDNEDVCLAGRYPAAVSGVALPMIESLLMQLKSTPGLEGRITAEFLDETDCVGLWRVSGWPRSSSHRGGRFPP